MLSLKLSYALTPKLASKGALARTGTPERKLGARARLPSSRGVERENSRSGPFCLAPMESEPHSSLLAFLECLPHAKCRQDFERGIASDQSPERKDACIFLNHLNTRTRKHLPIVFFPSCHIRRCRPAKHVGVNHRFGVWGNVQIRPLLEKPAPRAWFSSYVFVGKVWDFNCSQRAQRNDL